MPIRIPDLTLPLVAVSACASRISLSDHPDISPLVPSQRTQEFATIDGGYVGLIREQFESGKVHIHLDVVKNLPGEKVPCATASLEELQEKFDALLGKTLHVNFNSRFLVSAKDMPPASLIRALSTGAIKINNITASLAVAQLRLTDSVFNRINWRQVDRRDAPPDFIIEVGGQLGEMPVTPELLIIAIGRAQDGLRRFVMPGPTPTQGTP
jgi:hypothetical protein